MALTSHTYGKWLVTQLTSPIDFDSDTLKMSLLSSYTVGSTLTTAQYLSDVVTAGVGVEASGDGYTAGGATLASVSVTFTAANSWGTARASSTAYSVGDVVRPSSGNGWLYECVVAGTSGSTAPTFSTALGVDTTDGTVTWSTAGIGIVVVDWTDPSWTTTNPGTLSASYGLVYKDTGSASTSPVVGYIDFGDAKSASNGGALTVENNSTTGGFVLFA